MLYAENTTGPLMVQFADSLCRTEMREITFAFQWTIYNLSLMVFCTSRYLHSSIFSAREADQTKFRLHLSCISIHNWNVELHLESNNKMYAPIRSKLSIINSRGEEVKISEKSTEPVPENPINWYLFAVTKKALMFGNPPEEKLTVHCEITIVAEFVTETRNLQEKDNTQIQEGRDPTSDFAFLLENPLLSDVTLVAEGKEFFAHRVILAGRSPVFAAMFMNETEEKAQDRLDIADLSHEVVAEMLRFVYTGKALRIETMAAGLLVAADKYALKGLVRVCVEALSRNITVETASEILVLADMHKLNHLKEKVVEFINYHSEDVRKTNGWKGMTQNQPQLIIETFVFRSG